MYLLDSDTVSNYLRGNELIGERVINTPPEQIFVSGIAVEELMQGALAVINRLRSRPSVRLDAAYKRLTDLVNELAKFNLLPFDYAADQRFRAFGPGKKRIGTQDCRIAASALEHGYIVVTCNEKDFSQLGVPFEDWSTVDALQG